MTNHITNRPGNRILAQNTYVSNDTRKTALNNNDVIVGPSGCGKTGGYVIPNIRLNQGSMVVADTKGTLCRMLTPELEKTGYIVKTLDFVNPQQSCGYNPLDYIRPNPASPNGYREQDLFTIANTLVPIMDAREPFWENAAKSLIVCLLAFVKEALPKHEQNLSSVLELLRIIKEKKDPSVLNAETVLDIMMEELCADKPNSFAYRQYKALKVSFEADKMWSSIMQFAMEGLKMFDFGEAKYLCTSDNKFQIQELGRKKMILFVNISDTDRAFDSLINVFYSQLLQVLCSEADKNENGRLKIPVRIILDDFATNVYIPNFEKIISVIRSREISVSLILQSITQLETLYTPAQAKTIINNCDHMLYLGGQDVDTAAYVSSKANKPTDAILNMSLTDAYLFTRGEKPQIVTKVKPYSSIRPIPLITREKEEAAKYPNTATG